MLILVNSVRISQLKTLMGVVKASCNSPSLNTKTIISIPLKGHLQNNKTKMPTNGRQTKCL